MRSCGIILSVTSLPSVFGIGDLGCGARKFVNFLRDAGQRYWQILPLGRPVKGNCPYCADSAFACDPALIDPENLCEEGFIAEEDIRQAYDGFCDEASCGRKSYDAARAAKERLLKNAWERINLHAQNHAPVLAQMWEFRKENAGWIEDYALFRAAKALSGETEFPDRAVAALYAKKPEWKEEIDFQVFAQYIFFRQWDALHDYAKERGVEIIGDIPIYVTADSADVWAHPELFQLDSDGKPACVAGCPPDYFSEEGQLWENPLYDWDHMRDTGYGWWLERIGLAGRIADVLRIDHFRGLESYYSIPAGAQNAKCGEWKIGPGMDFINKLKTEFPDLKFIAEDLGYITPEARRLQEESGFLGMKVLQFAFEAGADSTYLPRKYESDCVCYTGTHDNETLAGWLASMPREDFEFCRDYLGLNEEEGYLWGVIRGGMSSQAGLFMAQMQDYLELGNEARMNVPGTVSPKNWSWRLDPDFLGSEFASELAGKILVMAVTYGRF